MGSYLIISQSARALAESARLGNNVVYCLDYFSDEDTKAVSVSVDQLQNDYFGFNETELLDKARSCVAACPEIKIVTGSGFEVRPEQLKQLSKLAPVIANSSDTLNKVIQPELFNRLLADNSIKCPQTCLSRPKQSGRYLLKKPGGVGGVHVQWHDADVAGSGTGHYYQEYIPGKVFSAVFLAKDEYACLIGFNMQLQTRQFDGTPFLYKGAISFKGLTQYQHDEMVRIVKTISKATGLKGLCGLDFILNENGDIFVLEVNPRPPATFELHEQSHSLFNAHVECFDNKKPDFQFNSIDTTLNGYLIVYAEHDIHITETVSWPDWVKDRPEQDTIISRQSPICTVHAKANSINEVEKLLSERVNQIELKITTMQNAA